MKRVISNHIFLWKILFKEAPFYMLYVIYNAFRYQFFIFVEHTLGIRYVLHCAEYHEPFYKAAIAVIIILLLTTLSFVPDGFFQQGWTQKTKPRLYRALKDKMYEKAAELDLSCYDNPDYYNEFVLAVSESEKSIDRFLELIDYAVQSITLICTGGVFYLVNDPIGIVFCIASFALTFFAAKKLNKTNFNVRIKNNPFERKRNYVSRIFYLRDFAKELRLHPEMKEKLLEEFGEANDEIVKNEKKVSGMRIFLMFLKRYLFNDFLMDTIYIGYLAYRVVVLHGLDYSTSIVLAGRTGDLKESMEYLTDIPVKAGENSLYIDKVRAFLDYKPEIEKHTGSDVPEGSGELVVSNLSFRYSPESDYVLKDISLKAAPGEKIAIVGYNGSGKTTLVKLLMRLYDPSEGEITYHGTNLKEFNLDKFHNRMGVVFQDFNMYGGSLAENVFLDDHEPDDDDRKLVKEALVKSGFSDRLDKLEAGLETSVTTEFDKAGVDFSGGEKQKVAIARAFYRDADILIMDEPSSALDPIAEYNLNVAMHEAAKNKTVFYISHRLSTTRDADRIIMLEKGRIIEEGTHEELLRRGGKYAKMWEVQANRYIAG
ncbi:MAG: ABC transporter ATP-binding protein/permease [Lachnospiraceae bacterium]|nr:ABC transporter ATP-binding protein/permease [Lachnospiraceae bacterium]